MDSENQEMPPLETILRNLNDEENLVSKNEIQGPNINLKKKESAN